jgi:hypothetical protein
MRRPPHALRRSASPLRAALAGLLALALGAGCSAPYRAPKTLAGIGTALLVTGGAVWVVGDRRDRPALATGGMVAAGVGLAAAIAAGGWLATALACRSDPDCPQGEECREIPALPGTEPYKQCMRR